MKTFDVVVVGLGAWGGACLRQLSKRGRRTLGIDRFSPPHTMGSTHGRLRVIVPGVPHVPTGDVYSELAAGANDFWRETEQDCDTQLLITTGGLVIGHPESPMMMETRVSHEALAVPYEVLRPKDVARRFSMFRLRPHEVAFWDTQTAIALVEATIKAQLEFAARHGAEIHTDEVVESWSVDSGRVEVRTSRGIYEAERLVLAAGGWSGDLLDQLVEITSERQVFAWFRTAADQDPFTAERCPVFVLEAEPPHEFIYGTPDVAGAGVRLALHAGGTITHPDSIDRKVHDADVAIMLAAIEGRVIGLDATPIDSSVCFYPHAPDRRLCIGVHPAHPEVLIAAGSSGHGFRFSQKVGSLIADLLTGEQHHDLSLYDPGRFLAGREPAVT